jgi:hypothetical protein
MSELHGVTMPLILLAMGLMMSGYGLAMTAIRARLRRGAGPPGRFHRHGGKLSFQVTARRTPGLRGLS